MIPEIKNPYLGFLFRKIDDEVNRVISVYRKNVIEWGDSDCPHVHKTMPHRPKRACDICWNTFKGE